jgi:hypothetical protein
VNWLVKGHAKIDKDAKNKRFFHEHINEENNFLRIVMTSEFLAKKYGQYQKNTHLPIRLSVENIAMKYFCKFSFSRIFLKYII